MSKCKDCARWQAVAKLLNAALKTVDESWTKQRGTFTVNGMRAIAKRAMDAYWEEVVNGNKDE